MRAIYQRRFSDRAASDKAFCKSSTCGKQQRRIYCTFILFIFDIKCSFQNSHFTKNITGDTGNIKSILHFPFSTKVFIKLIKKNARGIFLH